VLSTVDEGKSELEHSARAIRNMRVLFWIFTCALLAASHYPKLAVGTPGDSPDKLIHFFGYGGWAVLLWASGYVRNLFLVVLLTVLFGLFDEVTQAIPVLGRSADIWDLVADSIGAFVAVVWIHALGPTGVRNTMVRRSEQFNAMAIWRLLESPLNLGNIAVASVFGALLGGVILAITLTVNPLIGPSTSVVLGAAAGGLVGLTAGIEAGRRRMLSRIMGSQEHVIPLPGAKKHRIFLLTMLWIAVVMMVLTVSYIVAIALSPSVAVLGWITRRHEALGMNLALMFDVAVVGGVAGFVVRRARVRLAKQVAAGGEHCVNCRQDLRGVPDEAGIGRCPECGHQFARM
jgi:VanZ family protein